LSVVRCAVLAWRAGKIGALGGLKSSAGDNSALISVADSVALDAR
jgi:hypothetical protein